MESSLEEIPSSADAKNGNTTEDGRLVEKSTSANNLVSPTSAGDSMSTTSPFQHFHKSYRQSALDMPQASSMPHMEKSSESIESPSLTPPSNSRLSLHTQLEDGCFSKLNRLVVFLIISNLFIYMDRGIIPGSSEELLEMISKNVSSSHADIFLGLLTSSYIFGISIASPLFGHFVHHSSPLLLLFVGLVVWATSLIMSSFAGSMSSYYFLLISRMMSGSGEAGFVTIAFPLLATASGRSQGVILGAFTSMLPIGLAAGMAYGAACATSPYGFPLAFTLLGVVGYVIAAFAFALLPYYSKNGHFFFPSSNHEDEFSHIHVASDCDVNNIVSDTVTPKYEEQKDAMDAVHKNNFNINGKENFHQTIVRGSVVQSSSRESVPKSSFKQGSTPEIVGKTIPLDLSQHHNDRNIITSSSSSHSQTLSPSPTTSPSRLPSPSSLSLPSSRSPLPSPSSPSPLSSSPSPLPSSPSPLPSSPSPLPSSPSPSTSRSTQHQTFTEELTLMLTNCPYMMLVFASACYAAVLQVLTTFGTNFLLQVGFFTSEIKAASVMASVACVSGICGTLIGGCFVDTEKPTEDDPIDNINQGEHEVRSEGYPSVHANPQLSSPIQTSKQKRYKRLVTINICFVLVAYVLLSASVFLTSVVAFLALISCGLCCLYATQVGINLAQILAVHKRNCFFAMALVILLMHLFGDAPFPILFGWLKGYLVGDCFQSEESSTHEELDALKQAECRQNRNFWLRLSFFLLFQLLMVMLIFLVVARYLTDRIVVSDTIDKRNAGTINQIDNDKGDVDRKSSIFLDRDNNNIDQIGNPKLWGRCCDEGWVEAEEELQEYT